MAQIHLLLGALVAAQTAAQCLELLAHSRRQLGFRVVGFRDSVQQPVVQRLPGHLEFAREAGWPEALMRHWSEIAPALPLGAATTRLGDATPWQLPEPDEREFDQLSPSQRRAVRRMREAGIYRGATVRVARPFGRTGCVTWFTQESSTTSPDATVLPLVARTFFSSFDRHSGLGAPNSLSERELACLRWAARGLTDKEIGQVLGRSVDTVRFHMKSIVRKLGVSNRTHAVAVCVHAGVIDPQAD